MKKISIYIALLLSLYSCDNLLDVTCETGVTYQNYFKSEADLEDVVTFMLRQEVGTYSSDKPNLLELAGLPCDEYYDEGYRSLKYTLFAGEESNTSWGSFYDIIYMTNLLEDNETRFEGIAQDRIDFWLGQANFMKALAYFNIARIWGDAPIPANSDQMEAIGKSPVRSVLEEAIRCAEKALVLPPRERLMNASGGTIASRQYASLGTVNTLLAHIYAWMGGLYQDNKYWKQAEHYASEVIEGRSGTYKLEDNIGLLMENTLGKARKSDETIFEIEINGIDRDYYYQNWLSLLYPGVSLQNYPYFTTDPAGIITRFRKTSDQYTARIKVETVENLYEAGDVRRDSFWYRLGTQTYMKKDVTTGDEVETLSPYAYLVKWRDIIRSENEHQVGMALGVDGNRVIWRLADLILLRAECRVHTGGDAVADLDRIRKRAGLNGYEGSGDLQREIFRERERELFGEGHRYYDIVRNGYLDQLSYAYQSLSVQDIQHGALYLPVNKKAFNKNDLMTQNTYWLWRK